VSRALARSVSPCSFHLRAIPYPRRIGRHEEDKLREAWTKINQGSRLRSFHFTLKGGVKVGQALLPWCLSTAYPTPLGTL
jgi:hypothetical protein